METLARNAGFADGRGDFSGDATRVVLYAAPAALLLIAAGIAPTWAWLTAKAPWARVGLVILLLVPAANIAFTTFVKPLKRRDSATPVEFVLAHRQADEPVVGILWEQYYYCRVLGPNYRALFPARRAPETPLPTVVLDAEGKPTGQSVRSLWLLTIHDRAGQANQVGSLQPGGAWRILERYPFRDVTVLHVGRD